MWSELMALHRPARDQAIFNLREGFWGYFSWDLCYLFKCSSFIVVAMFVVFERRPGQICVTMIGTSSGGSTRWKSTTECTEIIARLPEAAFS